MRKAISDQQQPRIVLMWLTRLRWVAVGAQVAALFVAILSLKLKLSLVPVGLIVGATALSNLLVALWTAKPERDVKPLIPGLIILDVLLLTALLYFTGGPSNPFATLYVVHVVMAMVVLGPAWSWTVVILAGFCYAMLFPYHRPLIEPGQTVESPGLSYTQMIHVGAWIALMLELGVISYVISRLARSLRDRETELVETKNLAARNEHLAALTTLAAGAAHELGTPLGTIAVVARELERSAERGGATGSDFIEDARLIRREVDRCRKILDRMRVDIVQDPSHTSRTAVAELFEHVRQDFPEEDRARLIIQRDPDAKIVKAPLRAVQQALGVMVRNAFDASPAGATVTLEAHRNDGMVELKVIDRGSGMPEDVTRRAGEPFFTTKQPGQGMGLGLFLVRLVAERCEGRWHIESSEGVGTTAVLELPAASESRIEEQIPTVPPAPTRIQSIPT